MEEKNFLMRIYNVAIGVGFLVTFYLFSKVHYYDIDNLFLLPLTYAITLPLVKLYYRNNFNFAVTIIEITKFGRYIVLPLTYVASDYFNGIDLNIDRHEEAVLLMCYELVAVSFVMFLYSRKKTSYNHIHSISQSVVIKHGIIVKGIIVLWVMLILLYSEWRDQLFNFSIKIQQFITSNEPQYNNIQKLLFEIGKVFIYVYALNLVSKHFSKARVVGVLFVSLLFISSSWSDGFSVSRWGLIVFTAASLYALMSFYPEKRQLIATIGVSLTAIIVIVGSMMKMLLWGYANVTASDATNVFLASNYFDYYFEGVYSVSNGLDVPSMYGSKIGLRNFLSDLFYHFPFAVRIFSLTGHGFSEYYYKIAVGDTSLICPNLVQSYFYFGKIGCPFFSCLSVWGALHLSKKLETAQELTVRLLYFISIFWFSLVFCVNFTVTEAHIWFLLIGVWLCKQDEKLLKRGNNK